MARKKRSSARPPGKKTSKKPRLAIIGAGRIGTAVGRALQDLGYSIDVVITAHERSARRAARQTDAGNWVTAARLNQPRTAEAELFSDIELLLIATPDDVIPQVAARLARLLRSSRLKNRSGKRIALHLSGAVSSSVLEPLAEAGFATGSLHPLVSVSDPSLRTGIFRQVSFCVEGDGAATRMARSIVRDLGGKSFTIDPKSKALYHAAAVMASGNAVALFDMSAEMLSRCGLSRRQAQEALLPLLRSTVENLSRNGSSRALTGPFARGDVITIRNHLAALRSRQLGQALEAYLALGERSIQLAKGRSSDSAKLSKIARILSEQKH